MQIWITSDNHFGHHNMYKFTYTDKYGQERRVRERFQDAAEGDAYMVQRWCELVKPSDHVWHIGDVTMERSSNAKTWFVNKIRSLPGHKRLVLGNHDQLTMDVYMDAGFKKIKGSHRYEDLLFTHYPVHESSIGSCIANIHGHTHQNDSPPGPYINMCVEKWDFSPVPLDVILDKAKKLHEEWKNK